MSTPPPSVRPGDRSRSTEDDLTGSGWSGFVHRHGWRAYALPVLAVVTVCALLAHGWSPHRSPAASGRQPDSAGASGGGSTSATEVTPTGSRPTPSAKPSATPGARPAHAAGRTPASDSVKVEATGGGEQLSADALPPGARFTVRGSGSFDILAGTSAKIGHGALRTFDIEVEHGVTGVDRAAFAATVMATLSDQRSWTGNGTYSLQRVSTARADFHISLTTPITLRAPCDYQLKIETSCWAKTGSISRVYLNLARWVRGDTQFAQDLPSYRLYMINHEVGHALGHQHTYTCLPNGLAPVMMQQTITLRENQGAGKKICEPNVWPFPPGVDPKVAVPT